ncbi:MAG: tRNA-binding protein [Deltaproteobacteria bacterium]|uniref:tRNA-binding protein n=1 Tax=Candidatus Zymogenus saltonus TaxID=2844893 RepID=A0A9D8PSA3_9DELT|nr:tRNA-binding protein [Candidatus Zymogenus saltonus]
MIDYELFRKVDMRVGTVVSVKLNEKARVPSYVLTIDLGGLGTRLSSAQIVDLHKAEELVGRQVVCVANLPPKRIAGIKSEVLILGVDGDSGVVLLAPERSVGNGVRVY